MSAFTYIGLFLLVAIILGGLAYFLGAPPLWIGIGVALIVGVGIFTGRD